MIKKNLKFILFLLISTIFLACSQNVDTNNQNKLIESKDPIDLEEEKKITGVFIIKVNDQKKEINYEIKQGKTIFDLMQNLKETNNNFDFKYQESNIGVFVEEINGIKNDLNNNKFWIYKINDKEAEVGVSSYILQGGEKIEFEYQTIEI
jgi:transcriptional regulator